MKYLSLFSGIGGFELGIQQAYETIASINNQSIIEVCNAINVDKRGSSIKGEKSVRIVSESINLSGESRTSNRAEQRGESTTPSEGRKFLRCMEENVPVAENPKNSSSHLNIKTEMDTKTGRNTEQGICTTLLSKKKTNQNTKSSAITATTQEEGMGSVPMCVGFSEIDKYAISIYEKHFPTHQNFGDITKIKAEDLPEFDLLVAGFPCPSWSIAGKRGGFEDLRGQLVFDIIRILRGKKPRMFLLENVKGILSHDKGNSMEVICEALCESGYAIDFEVLNSKDFGVPQSRERVFIIGKRLDTLPSGAIY